MFTEKKPVKTENGGLSNRILTNTYIKGEVSSDSDFRIDGKLLGQVHTSGKLVIGKTGTVEGKAQCETADIEGVFKGDLVVSGLLALKGTAFVEGEVVASKLSVEAGAVFNASCNMNSNKVKAIHSGESSQKSAS